MNIPASTKASLGLVVASSAKEDGKSLEEEEVEDDDQLSMGRFDSSPPFPFPSKGVPAGPAAAAAAAAAAVLAPSITDAGEGALLIDTVKHDERSYEGSLAQATYLPTYLPGHHVLAFLTM